MIHSDSHSMLLRPSRTRSLVIDAVRGMAISLVVLGHTNQGVQRRGWWNGSDVGTRLNDAIYAFHMPTFFLVSGVFLMASVAKKGPRHFAIERVRTVLYPYALWVGIYFLSTILFHGFMTQQTPSLKDLVYNLLTGYNSWFLPSLFFTLIVATLLRTFFLPFVFIASLLIQLYLPPTHIVFLDDGFRYLPFVILGMLVGPYLGRLETLTWYTAAGLALGIGVCIVVITGLPAASSKYLLTPLGVSGALMLILAAGLIAARSAARLLAWVGEASLGVFLISQYPQGGTREVLLHLTNGVPHPYLQLFIPTLLAIVIPAWIYQQRVRLHLQWLFVWPFRSTAQEYPSFPRTSNRVP